MPGYPCCCRPKPPPPLCGCCTHPVATDIQYIVDFGAGGLTGDMDFWEPTCKRYPNEPPWGEEIIPHLCEYLSGEFALNGHTCDATYDIPMAPQVGYSCITTNSCGVAFFYLSMWLYLDGFCRWTFNTSIRMRTSWPHQSCYSWNAPTRDFYFNWRSATDSPIHDCASTTPTELFHNTEMFPPNYMGFCVGTVPNVFVRAAE